MSGRAPARPDQLVVVVDQGYRGHVPFVLDGRDRTGPDVERL